MGGLVMRPNSTSINQYSGGRLTSSGIRFNGSHYGYDKQTLIHTHGSWINGDGLYMYNG
jgi:hypothetical protein